MARRPNILFILADDLGIGDISAWNPDLAGIETTPNLDTLIDQCALLDQHYSSSCVCMPARATLISGMYPQRVGTVDLPHHRPWDYMDPEATTLPQILSSSGYATGLVGKWHLGTGPLHPSRRGFDESICFCAPMIDYYNWTLDAASPDRKRPSDGRYLTDVLTEEADAFIRRHKNHPWMLHLAYNAPHTPYQAPLEDVLPYARTGRYNQNVSTLYGMVRRMDAGIGRILRTLDQLGLRDNTLIVFTSDNGPVQSPEMRRFNTNLRGGKCTVWEGGIRVPLLISWPDGIQPGRTLSHMTHFADWMPTLLSAAGCQEPDGLDHDGQNLLPLLQGQAPDLPVTRFWQWTRYEVVPMHNAAVRDGDWKLLCPAAGNYLLNLDNPKGYTDAELGDYCTLLAAEMPEASGVASPRRDGWQNIQQYAQHLKEVVTRPKPDGAGLWKPQPKLFDLASDPGETTDLAQAHPDIVQRLHGKLEDWFSRIEPQWKRHLQANPYYANDAIGARGLHTPPGRWVLHD